MYFHVTVRCSPHIKYGKWVIFGDAISLLSYLWLIDHFPVWKKNSTWIKSIPFHFTAEPLQSNNSSNYYSSGCKNAKANAFATVGPYGFLSPSLDYSESRETIVRNAIDTENY